MQFTRQVDHFSPTFTANRLVKAFQERGGGLLLFLQILGQLVERVDRQGRESAKLLDAGTGLLDEGPDKRSADSPAPAVSPDVNGLLDGLPVTRPGAEGCV